MMNMRGRNSESGVMMAMVVILFTASVLLLTALLQMVTTTSNFTNEIVYRQIAQAAAKSALEEGKENFDSSVRFDELDKNEDGTIDNDTNTNNIPDPLEEKLLFENNTYRVTYQLQIKAGSTSADGRSKTTIATGRVYLPKSSSTPRYTKVLSGEIVRSQIVSNNPSDFSPLAWYDASCGPPSTEIGCELPTVLEVGTANVAANPISLREENKATGAHCGGAPSTTSPSDSRLSMTKNGECGLTTEQRVGLLFNAGSGLAKGSTIETANLQFTAGGQDNQSVTLRVRGIKVSNRAAFTTASGTQLSPATNAYTDWTPGSWPNSAQSGNKQQTPNLSAVIQEVIDQPGWATGNSIGFVIECVSTNCSNTRRALMNPLTLNITYSGYTAADNNDLVQVWRDRSGNGFHLTALDAGSRPTRSTVSQFPNTSTINGKPMVSFPYNPSAPPDPAPSPSPNTGKAMTTTVPLSTGRKANSFTTFAVIKIGNSTDYGVATHNGHILSFRGAGTNNNTVIPYWRHPIGALHTPSENNITGDYVCQGGAVSSNIPFERQCRYLNLIARDGDWTILSNRSELDSVEALFRYHGDISNPTTYTFTPLPLDAPYTIALGYNPTNNVKAAELYVSELIIYDRTLSCPQMEAVEQYLADKWEYHDPTLLSTSKYVSEGCRENNIPAF